LTRARGIEVYDADTLKLALTLNDSYQLNAPLK
jgi:hypothetical protein